MSDKMSWVDEVAKEQEENQEKGYFKFAEGDNRIQILTNAAQLVQRWTGMKYETMIDGDPQEGKSIKGVAYVLQDNEIKLAFLPYTVIKQLRALQNDPDWAFDEFPMPRLLNIKAKNAGSKEVEYSVIPSPKESAVSQSVLDELAKKKTPEDIVQAMKDKRAPKKIEYPENDESEKIPF